MNAPVSSESFRSAHRPAGHPEVRSGRIGVLLVNLGTPEATDYWSMRRYLKEFLSDRRVVETNRLLWWPILNLVILSRRPQMKGKRLRGDLEQGARREPAEDHHARNRREARRRAGGGRARSRRALCRRLGDALRQAVDRRTPRGAAGRRLRPHPARAALSAILRRHQRDSLRQGVRRPQDDALAAGAAGSRRRTTTIPSISAPSRNRSARGSRRSISSRKSSSPRSTGYRAPISTRAIPIIAIAPRPGGCCARRSACRRNGSS